LSEQLRGLDLKGMFFFSLLFFFFFFYIEGEEKARGGID